MIDLQPFEYQHDGVTLTGRLAMPRQTGPRPAVLVFHHANGPSQFDCDRAQRLADSGYVAFAPDLFGFGWRESPPEDYVPIFRAFHDDPSFVRGRLRAAMEALRSLPEVDPARISAIGFCLGGFCALELARSGADLVSIVSFHGLLTTRQPAELGAVKAKVLVLTGALDPFAPPADVQRLQEEMAAAKVDLHLTIYGSGYHAFTNPAPEQNGIAGVHYDAMLDKLSWAQAMAALEAFSVSS